MSDLLHEGMVMDLRKHGFTEEAARRQVEMGDLVDDRAHALEDAIGRVREGLCTILDGPQGYHYQTALEDYKEAISDLKTEWQRFTTTMDSALQRIEGGK